MKINKIAFIAVFTAILSALTASSAEAFRATRAQRLLENGIKSKRFGAPKYQERKRYFSSIVEITDPSAIENLIELGCVIFGQREELALVCVPEELEDEFFDTPGLGEISVAQTSVSSCDVLRTFTGVDKIYSNPDYGFTGKNVVVGLSDIGFDAHHSAFRNRISRFSYFNDTIAVSFRHDSPQDILNQGTENPSQTHAAKCANILGGAKESSRYHGIAYNSDLVVATSSLYDCGILAGIDEVIDYAKSVGKPASVSLSIASYTGPHDGTDLFCRYLSKQAKEALISVSAGNEGGVPNSLKFTFSENNPELKAAIRTRGYALNLSGRTDVWVKDNSPISFTLELWDDVNKTTVYSRPITIGNESEPTNTVIFSEEDPEGLGKYFLGGGIAIATEVHPSNNRNSIIIYYVLNPRNGEVFDHFPVIRLSAAPGTEVELFTDSSRSIFNWETSYGFTPGNDEMSVNNFACTPGVICVGSITARETFSLENGYSYNIGYPYNEPTPFSGYGKELSSIGNLPHLIAPGVGIMTAVSSYLNPTAGFSTIDSDGHTSYWQADDGTSFSTPAVAAIAALWLEANPDLSPEDIKNIALETASRNFINSTSIQSGAGSIDALAGLKKALESSNIPSVSIKDPKIHIYVEGRTIRVISDAQDVRLDVFSAAGIKINPENLTPGLYICKASANSYSTTKTIIIK